VSRKSNESSNINPYVKARPRQALTELGRSGHTTRTVNSTRPVSETVKWPLRLAGEADVSALEALIPASVRALQSPYYSPAQMEAALGAVFAVDHQLIRDAGRLGFTCGSHDQEHGERSMAVRPIPIPVFLCPHVETSGSDRVFLRDSIVARGARQFRIADIGMAVEYFVSARTKIREKGLSRRTSSEAKRMCFADQQPPTILPQ